MRNTFLPILIFGFILSIKGFTQIYNFDFITVKDGLSQSQVESFCIDDMGNLWVGTRYGGLNVYNGSEVFQFDEASGMPELRISELMRANDGKIYIGTDNGIYVFDGKTFEFPDSASNGFAVNEIVESDNGSVWIASGNGLLEFKNSSFVNITKAYESNKNAQHVFCMKNDVYFNWNDRIHVYREGEVIPLYVNELEGCLITDGLYDEFNDKFWFSTDKGLIELKNNQVKIYDKSNGLLHNSANKIELDHEGNLWISYNDIGLTYFNGKDFISISKDQGIRHNYLNELFIDDCNRLWLGFNGGGFALFKGFLFKHFEIDDDDTKKQVVMSVLIDEKNTKWFGTDANGLVKYDGEDFVFYGKSEGLTSNYINDILKGKDGTMWVATQSGLAKYNQGYLQKIEFADQIIGVISLMESSNGQLYIGTRNSGVFIKRGNEFINLRTGNGLAGNVIWDMFEASNGLIYIATGNGFSVYDQNNLVNFSEKDGLVNNSISTIIEDQYENIWIGTDNGLSFFDGKNFKNYTVDNGLLSNVIYFVKLDNENNIWIGAEKGISKIKANSEGEIVEIISYTEQEGFTGIECNHNAIDIDNDDQIWIGTINGITVYNPHFVKAHTTAPEVFISGIDLFYKEVDWSAYADSLVGFYETPTGLELPQNQNYLTFHFVGVDLEYPNLIKYQFMLEGLDDDWSPLTSNTFASYTNIPPGVYVFKVRALGKGDLWSNVASCQFQIEKPFWLKLWFLICIVLFIAVLIFYFIRIRTSKLSKYSKLLELKVKERTFELDKQNKSLEKAIVKVQEVSKFKEAFLANTSHEIRTPLNAILGYTNLLLTVPEKSILQKQHIEYIRNVQKSGENMLVIVNDILDFSKIEAGKLTIEKISFDIREAVQNVVSTLNVKAAEKKIDFGFEIDESIPRNLLGDPHRIAQILFNIIGNAIKFTSSGGNVKLNLNLINLSQNDCKIKFIVEDTGIGIDESKLKTIFESFQQAEFNTTRNYGGTGLGLAIVKNLVELMDGMISVESKIGIGSKFAVELSFERAVEPPAKQRDTQLDVELYDCHPKDIKLLLVEDNIVNAKLAIETIRSWNPDVYMETARNGREAIELFGSQTFNMVFMDLQMPEMDGYEAIIKIRNEFPKPISQIPIIAMSAHAMKREKERCINLGVNEYMVKPFNPNHIYKLIKFYSCPKVIKEMLNGGAIDIGKFKCTGKAEKKVNRIRPVVKVESKSTYKFIDLRTLEKMNGGDERKVKNLLESYLDNIPSKISALEENYHKKNWQEIKNAAHSIKPSMFYLGLNTLYENMKLIEKKASVESEKEKVFGFILESKSYWLRAEEEIRQYLEI